MNIFGTMFYALTVAFLFYTLDVMSKVSEDVNYINQKVN
jgi:hypothetical protein